MGYQTICLKGDGAQIIFSIVKKGYKFFPYNVKLSSTFVPRIENDLSLKQNEHDVRSNQHLSIFIKGNHVALNSKSKLPCMDHQLENRGHHPNAMLRYLRKNSNACNDYNIESGHTVLIFGHISLYPVLLPD